MNMFYGYLFKINAASAARSSRGRSTHHAADGHFDNTDGGAGAALPPPPPTIALGAARAGTPRGSHDRVDPRNALLPPGSLKSLLLRFGLQHYAWRAADAGTMGIGPRSTPPATHAPPEAVNRQAAVVLRFGVVVLARGPGLGSANYALPRVI